MAKAKTKSADEIIQEIAKTLGEASGEMIETIANMILVKKVVYLGDSMFRQDEQGGDYNSDTIPMSLLKKGKKKKA